jgi:hypothetical protein
MEQTQKRPDENLQVNLVVKEKKLQVQLHTGHGLKLRDRAFPEQNPMLPSRVLLVQFPVK